MKNEKVAKGRIIGLAGPCSLFTDFFLALEPFDIAGSKNMETF